MSNQITAKLANWKNGLYSADFETIKKTIDDIYDNGNTQIISDVLSVYKGYIGTEIENYFYSFLVCIKSKDFPSILIHHIKDKKFSKIKSNLLSICWESTLDFSDFSDTFIDIFIKEPINIAFEAFTVVQNSFNISEDNLKKGILKLELSVSSISQDKKELLVELVHDFKQKLNLIEQKKL